MNTQSIPSLVPRLLFSVVVMEKATNKNGKKRSGNETKVFPAVKIELAKYAAHHGIWRL